MQKRWKWTKLNPIEILCQHFLGASIQNELVLPSLHCLHLFSLLPPALSVPELLTSKRVSVNAGSPLRCRQKKRHTQNMAFIAQIIDRSPHKSSTSTVPTSVKLRGGCMWLIGGRGAALVIYACLSLAKTQRFLWRRAAPDGSLEANHAASNKNHMHGADTLLSGHPGGQAVVTSVRSRFLPPLVGVRWVSSVIGSRHGPSLNPSREIACRLGLGEKAKQWRWRPAREKKVKHCGCRHWQLLIIRDCEDSEGLDDRVDFTSASMSCVYSYFRVFVLLVDGPDSSGAASHAYLTTNLCRSTRKLHG